MKPEALLRKVEDAVDLLVAAGARHDGLIPSLLDRHDGEMLAEMPPAIPGQRQHDRAVRGSNPLHDVELLELMYQLARDPARERFAAAADRYLCRFARHCTHTVSGLFPWGEHAFWDLDHDCLGNSQTLANRTVSRGAYHDHLREAPVWLWERIHACDPECVRRFGLGLKYHWKSGALAHEYFRHAYIEKPEIPLPHEATSRDFPRHGAFYILDWAFAYCRFGNANFEAQMRRMNDYWWWHHHPSGMLPQSSRDDTEGGTEHWPGIGQTLSYAATTLDAAALLDREDALPDLAKSLRERAIIYAKGCLDAPSHPEKDLFYHAFDRETLEPAERAQLVPWGSTYSMQASVPSRATVSSQGLFMLRIYRQLPDERIIRWCEDAVRFILRTPFPKGDIVPAKDAGQALALMLDLHEATGNAEWLVAADGLVDTLTEAYFDAPLPRLASNCDWYEAQQGTGVLLQALGRCALLRLG